MRAAAAAAAACGYPDAVSFDMGGTSTDVCLIRGGRAEPAGLRTVAGLPIRMPSLDVQGKRVHQVGLPYHWGGRGLVKGDVVNDLTAWVGDPNVSIHEGKAFVCNVEKA